MRFGFAFEAFLDFRIRFLCVSPVTCVRLVKVGGEGREGGEGEGRERGRGGEEKEDKGMRRGDIALASWSSSDCSLCLSFSNPDSSCATIASVST